MAKPEPMNVEVSLDLTKITEDMKAVTEVMKMMLEAMENLSEAVRNLMLDTEAYRESRRISPNPHLDPDAESSRDCGHESPGTELAIPGRYLCALPKEHVGVHQYAQMCWTDSGKTWSESPTEAIARFDSEWARADALEGRR